MRNQRATHTLKWADMMARPAFRVGIQDASAGKGFRRAYETWPAQAQVIYEVARHAFSLGMSEAETRQQWNAMSKQEPRP